MLQVFHQSSDSTQGKTIATGLVPTVLQFRPGLPAQLSFSGGISTEATCVYCVDAPCVNYQIEEVRAAALPDFPADRNTAVCATSALTRPGEVGAPTVDPEACVSCGVCASRCPVGAIFLSPTAVVNDVASEIFVEADLNADAYRLLRNMFAGARREGVLLEETAVVVDQMQVRLERVCRNVDDRFPNHLARNMLTAVGVWSAMRRRGDNAVRMDLLFRLPESGKGVAEVEFGGEAVLDAPRDILDDIAVMVSRRGWDKKETAALIVCDVLPNKRSEYWEIIQDINAVLGVRIGTVTILALALLIWNRQMLLKDQHSIFYVDNNTSSYRHNVLEKLLGRAVNLGPALRPHIEVAK
jgi:ferredoxin